MGCNIRCFIAASLDGYIADAHGEVGWLFTDDDYGYSEFISNVDTLLIGRKTYQQVRSFGEWPYGDLRSYVFTSQQLPPDSNVTFVNGEATEFIHTLKSGPGGDIWLVGGGELNASCLRAGLLDELLISVHPLLLGQGVRLFDAPFDGVCLTQQNVQVYESGLIQLTYAVGKPLVAQEHREAAETHRRDTQPIISQAGESAPIREAVVALKENNTPAAPQPSFTPTKYLSSTEADIPKEQTASESATAPTVANTSPRELGAGIPLWLVALNCGFGVGLLRALMAHWIDIPLFFSLLFGVGIGSAIGALARKRNGFTLRGAANFALLCTLISFFTMQVGGAILARPAMVDHLSGVIAKSADQRTTIQASIESRLTPWNTLRLYQQMQSDSQWRSRYYGIGSRYMLSGSFYWALTLLSLLVFATACAAFTVLKSKPESEQEEIIAELRHRVEWTLHRMLGMTRDEPIETKG